MGIRMQKMGAKGWRVSGSKFGNIPTEVEGCRLDSKAEACRYKELMLLEKAGDIRNLEVHPRFDIVVNGVKVCTYTADFAYETEAGEQVVEDVKGVYTHLFALKRRLMEAVLGIKVRVLPARIWRGSSGRRGIKRSK